MKAALVIKDYVVSSHERGNCSLCAQDVENLQKWQVNKDMFDKPFQLTKEGYLESEGIGRRLKQAFPKLLAKLDKNDYEFRPAPGAWMADSAKAFVDGLYDRQLTVQPPRTDFDILSVSKVLYFSFLSCNLFDQNSYSIVIHSSTTYVLLLQNK